MGRRKKQPVRERGKIKRDGLTYHLYDAFPTKGGAKRAAKDVRSYGDKARVYDMGKKSGRLRHGVFVRETAKGKKRPRRKNMKDS